MTTQADKAEAFRALHVKGKPLVLYNIWDAGSAKVVTDAGANAIATGSWSVAAAHGYDDGEQIPLDLLACIAERICVAVKVPVTIDFEGGYAVDADRLRTTVGRILAAGAVGVNFEDRIVGGNGLHPVDQQCERIRALREAGNAAGIHLFINARTDLFLQQSDPGGHAALLPEALARAEAYTSAGADGFFVPGLTAPELIGQICQPLSHPVNVMKAPGTPSIAELSRLNVGRVSYGPYPYRTAMRMLAEQLHDVMPDDGRGMSEQS